MKKLVIILGSVICICSAHSVNAQLKGSGGRSAGRNMTAPTYDQRTLIRDDDRPGTYQQHPPRGRDEMGSRINQMRKSTARPATGGDGKDALPGTDSLRKEVDTQTAVEQRNISASPK